MNDEEGFQVGFRFDMSPLASLEIRCNINVSEIGMACDEKIGGVNYFLFWRGETMPLNFSTHSQAISGAICAQWAFKNSSKKDLK